MALIQIQQLSVGYEGKTVAKDIDFSIRPGEYLYVVGENGSGKSTLMKTLLGLLPALSGHISFGEGLQKNEIGYLPQQTQVQKDFPASVHEIVLSGNLNRCGLRPFYSLREKELARTNMEKLGIDALKKRCYRELSGGQQQRVLLARALCATRKLLVLDEPVAGLDPQASADMYALIRRLNQEEGITVVMVSHDMEAAMEYASHILHMGRGAHVYSSREAFASSPIDKKGGEEA